MVFMIWGQETKLKNQETKPKTRGTAETSKDAPYEKILLRFFFVLHEIRFPKEPGYRASWFIPPFYVLSKNPL